MFMQELRRYDRFPLLILLSAIAYHHSTFLVIDRALNREWKYLSVGVSVRSNLIYYNAFLWVVLTHWRSTTIHGDDVCAVSVL